jgi:hypothetical protein
VLLVGIDWAERHHDVCVMAADGRVLASDRVVDGVAGVARLHELIAVHADEPSEVVVGIETDRGLLVGVLVVAGYQVVAVNPLAASRYRERHTTRGPSRTGRMRGCWPIWSGPTGIITARCAATRALPRRSRCWPEGISSWSGRGSGRPTWSAAPCGLLPGGAGRLRRRPWRPGCGGCAQLGVDPGPGPRTGAC